MSSAAAWASASLPATFRTAGEVRFGRGRAAEAPGLVAGLGRRVLLVTGASSLAQRGLLARLTRELDLLGVASTRVAVPREPDVPLVDEATRACRESGAEVVLGVGGGSALDVAKAVASLVIHGGRARSYLEDVGPEGGHPITKPSLPTLLLPTTAGTGAEVTRNSVLRVPDLAVKRSMRSDLLLPRVAIVDPELSEGAPLRVAAAAGLDALTHLAEAAVSRRAQPMVDALVSQGLPLAMRALRALAQGTATAADLDGLALASLYGGMAVANAGLGAAHGLVAPLGGLLEVGHGIGCAALLPSVMVVNVAALRRAGGDGRRYESLARLLLGSVETPRGAPGGSSGSRPPDAARDPRRAAGALTALRRQLGLPGLTELGLDEQAITAVVAQARGGSMKANPVELTDDELRAILRGEREPEGSGGG